MAAKPQARDFYNSLAQGSAKDRERSQVFHLRKFNNWIKSTLFAAYAGKVKPGATTVTSVLDLACGKGGDLKKFWLFPSLRRYVGVDIAKVSLQHLVERFNSQAQRSSHAPVRARLACADLGNTDLEEVGVLQPGERFDIVSIQFALHYMFDTKERATRFFANLRGRVADGGVFVCTIPDANVLVRRVRNLPANETKFENQFFHVDFKPDSKKRQWRLGSNPFGCMYNFRLHEAVGSVDEALVPWELLKSLAADAGLMPVATYNFHDFFHKFRTKPEFRGLLQRMSVLDRAGSMSKDEWEVCGLYRVCVFTPARNSGARPVDATALAGLPGATHLTNDDILDVLGDSASAASAQATPHPTSYEPSTPPGRPLTPPTATSQDAGAPRSLTPVYAPQTPPHTPPSSPTGVPPSAATPATPATPPGSPPAVVEDNFPTMDTEDAHRVQRASADTRPLSPRLVSFRPVTPPTTGAPKAPVPRDSPPLPWLPVTPLPAPSSLRPGILTADVRADSPPLPFRPEPLQPTALSAVPVTRHESQPAPAEPAAAPRAATPPGDANFDDPIGQFAAGGSLPTGELSSASKLLLREVPQVSDRTAAGAPSSRPSAEGVGNRIAPVPDDYDDPVGRAAGTYVEHPPTLPRPTPVAPSTSESDGPVAGTQAQQLVRVLRRGTQVWLIRPPAGAAPFLALVAQPVSPSPPTAITDLGAKQFKRVWEDVLEFLFSAGKFKSARCEIWPQLTPPAASSPFDVHTTFAARLFFDGASDVAPTGVAKQIAEASTSTPHGRAATVSTLPLHLHSAAGRAEVAAAQSPEAVVALDKLDKDVEREAEGLGTSGRSGGIRLTRTMVRWLQACAGSDGIVVLRKVGMPSMAVAVKRADGGEPDYAAGDDAVSSIRHRNEVVAAQFEAREQELGANAQLQPGPDDQEDDAGDYGDDGGTFNPMEAALAAAADVHDDAFAGGRDLDEEDPYYAGEPGDAGGDGSAADGAAYADDGTAYADGSAYADDGDGAAYADGAAAYADDVRDDDDVDMGQDDGGGAYAAGYADDVGDDDDEDGDGGGDGW